MLSISDHSIRNGAKEAIFYLFWFDPLVYYWMAIFISVSTQYVHNTRCGVRKKYLDFHNFLSF